MFYLFYSTIHIQKQPATIVIGATERKYITFTKNSYLMQLFIFCSKIKQTLLKILYNFLLLFSLSK